MRFYKNLTVCALALVAGLGGCARDISSNVYSESHVGESSRTYQGVITNARKVTVQGSERLEDNTAGLIGGGVVGGVAGNQFGKGSGNLATTAAGALAGAALGSMAQKALKTQDAMEYTVRLASGEMRTVVQGMDNAMGVGQRIRLIESYRGRARIVPDAH